MTLNSSSESNIIRSQREYRLYPPIDESNQNKSVRYSAQTTNKPPTKGLHQLFIDQKAPVLLDRVSYKLRMKSDLHVKTLKAHDQNSHRHFPTGIVRSVKTKSASTRSQPRTSASISVKTRDDQEFQGIEGNAVHVGTLDDLIKQFRRAELHLMNRRIDGYRKNSAFISNSFVNQLERPMTKSSSDRSIKQAQTITEYRFPLPTARSHRERRQFPLLTVRDQYNILNSPRLSIHNRTSLTSSMIAHERQSTASQSKRRNKLDSANEKSPSSYNKLTIIDPFTANADHHEFPNSPHQQLTNSFVFPPIRSSGYFTKKLADDTAALTIPVKPKKHRYKKKKQLRSFESLEQFSTDDDTSQIFNETMKSMVSLASSDNDLDNPANTLIFLPPTPVEKE